ncbi:MAG: hypothetical protein IJ828_11640 [Treponema sp.]|nr:hypothetical protein [Treponema sp.]
MLENQNAEAAVPQTVSTFTDSIDNSRNPFTMVGKVFKYEFIATARKLALIYALIPVVALIMGLLFRNTLLNVILSNATDAMDEAVETRLVTTGMMMYFFTYIFMIVATVTTLIVLYNRFKKGMFGKEAYLNFTLPVSVGEHLLARVLSAAAWYLMFSVAILMSFLIFGLTIIDKVIGYMKAHNVTILSWNTVQDSFERSFHCPIIVFFISAFIATLVGSILFILFLYMISCVGHLVKKHRMLLQFATVVVSIAVANIVITKLFAAYALSAAQSQQIPNFVALLWTFIPINAVFAAICGCICYLVLKFRLNLE